MGASESAGGNERSVQKYHVDKFRALLHNIPSVSEVKYKWRADITTYELSFQHVTLKGMELHEFTCYRRMTLWLLGKDRSLVLELPKIPAVYYDMLYQGFSEPEPLEDDDY